MKGPHPLIECFLLGGCGAGTIFLEELIGIARDHGLPWRPGRLQTPQDRAVRIREYWKSELEILSRLPGLAFAGLGHDRGDGYVGPLPAEAVQVRELLDRGRAIVKCEYEQYACSATLSGAGGPEWLKAGKRSVMQAIEGNPRWVAGFSGAGLVEPPKGESVRDREDADTQNGNRVRNGGPQGPEAASQRRRQE